MPGTLREICRLVVLFGLAVPIGAATAQNATLNWKRLEADNGAAFAIDLNSISRFHNGTAQAVTCVVDNNVCLPPNMSRLWFDCRGHYRDIDRRGPTTIAPPRSVVGRMAEIACTPVAAAKPDQTTAPSASSATKAYGDCLIAEGKKGSYASSGTAFEGGKSVLLLIAKCQPQWDSWTRECVAQGGSEGGPNGCTMQSYLLAHGALKLLGK
jgi:hypothetical protein